MRPLEREEGGPLVEEEAAGPKRASAVEAAAVKDQ